MDRRKHDVDVIERVLGGIRDTVGPADHSTSLFDVEVPWFGGSLRSTVEMTVGVPLDTPESHDGSDGFGHAGPRRRSS